MENRGHATDAIGERLNRVIPTRRIAKRVFAILIGCISANIMISSFALSATFTTSISATTATWNSDLLADVTTWFNVTITTYSYLPDYWFVNLKGENQTTCSGIQPCQLDQDINNMIANSTYTYTYGWGDGVGYQQVQDIELTGQILQDCVNRSTDTFFIPGTTDYDLDISVQGCEEAVNAVNNLIFQQQLAAPTTGFWYP